MFAIVETIANAVVDSYKTSKAAGLAETQMELAARQAAYEAASKHEDALMVVSKGQTDQNIVESQTGQKGWRSWLGKGLTVIFLFLMGHVVLAMAALVWFGIFGLPLEHLKEAISLLPVALIETIWAMLSGMMGFLYDNRRKEKLDLATLTSPPGAFDQKAFFDTYRKLNDNNISPDEFSMLNAALKAALK